MTPRRDRKRYPCRFCGITCPTRLPEPQTPDGALLLGHLFQVHPTAVGRFLEQMRTEDIAQVAAQAFEVIEDDGRR